MQSKTTAPKPLVSVYAEKGVLAFRFSSKYNSLFEILDGKTPTKQRTMGLGLRESPENWKLAQSAALRIERDLSDSESWQILFDPTFVKYGLAVKYTSAALKLAAPIPEPEPEMTVGAMWEEYLIWKRPQLEATTYQLRFCKTYTNLIKGLVWNRESQGFDKSQYPIWELPISNTVGKVLLEAPLGQENKRKTLAALVEAFTRLQSQGKTKLTVNPFLLDIKTENKTDKYKSTIDVDGTEREWWDVPDNESDAEERDRRLFSKADMVTIISAFYNHKNASPRELAPLVEFRFLTGCRSGEAFALRWRDCFRGKEQNNIVFSRSYDGQAKVTKKTKKGETRIFKIYPKLNDLLLRIKPVDAQPNDLVFTKLNGKSWDTGAVTEIWHQKQEKHNGKKYAYSGVVTQLANDGLIDGYLPFYNCRHTFISLQAHAGTDLYLLATICGNSVEVIQKNYLGINPNVTVTDIF
jgi:integrase